ncbi:Aldehyde/histidinol dehydrogenase [Aspergillus karnatakaensis]|uniref:Aldehyde/histidinol dehydrogenase n=1 Tax=Aspergillus karnatakaensis TaxID=1810916 RepID=UPI003CCD2114
MTNLHVRYIPHHGTGLLQQGVDESRHRANAFRYVGKVLSLATPQHTPDVSLLKAANTLLAFVELELGTFDGLYSYICNINQTPIVTVHAATAEDVDAALVREHKADLATLEAWDNGKPYLAALEEDLEEMINCLVYYAGWADKVHGEFVQGPVEKLIYTVREPLGVCAQIIPWNYPLSMAAWKLGPALACGNTVVLKPAEQTPLSALYLAAPIKEAGFPPGVVNIINGYGYEAGAAIASHEGIDKIVFTGSTTTGKEVMKLAAGTLKNITLETGGKSPLIIFDDADLDQAVKWAHVGIMSNQGQICTATSRVVVGDPFDDNVSHGPQVSRAQYERILGYIDAAKREGATLLLGGEVKTGGRGYFVPPTVFADVTDDMMIYREEIFGPVVVVCKFSTEEEVVRRANDTIYGLAGAVFTENISKGHRVARKIQAGSVWVNSSQDADIRAPFGGYKQSGIGRELGQAGLEAYSTVKSVYVNLGLKI